MLAENELKLRVPTDEILNAVEKVIIGKDHVVRLALCALVAGGHVLIEDRPGVGKTTLAKALALTLGCAFKRIQFTPDLLPADVTGVSVFNQKEGEFEFRAGP
nr:AAA family ATPase [Armatimonadota bacterium]